MLKKKQNKKKKRIDIIFGQNCIVIWIDLFEWFDISLNSNQFGLILFNRMIELQKHLLWICKCVHSGAYHTAIRELRFILESVVQAYYMDKGHPDSNLECKIEIIKEIERLVGGTLIDRTDLKNKDKLKKLYQKLCKYIHSSYEELQEISHSKITFTYDKELFDKCYTFTNKVMDAIIFVLISFEKGIVRKIQEDEFMMQFLKKN